MRRGEARRHSVEQTTRRRESFPRARVLRLEHSGHWPMYDELAGTVVPFLAERPGTAAAAPG